MNSFCATASLHCNTSCREETLPHACREETLPHACREETLRHASSPLPCVAFCVTPVCMVTPAAGKKHCLTPAGKKHCVMLAAPSPLLHSVLHQVCIVTPAAGKKHCLPLAVPSLLLHSVLQLVCILTTTAGKKHCLTLAVPSPVCIRVTASLHCNTNCREETLPPAFNPLP